MWFLLGLWGNLPNGGLRIYIKENSARLYGILQGEVAERILVPLLSLRAEDGKRSESPSKCVPDTLSLRQCVPNPFIIENQAFQACLNVVKYTFIWTYYNTLHIHTAVYLVTLTFSDWEGKQISGKSWYAHWVQFGFTSSSTQAFLFKRGFLIDQCLRGPLGESRTSFGGHT